MATGDVHFESVWPTASGLLTSPATTDRSMLAAPSVTNGAGQVFWITSSGGITSPPLQGAACPWPIVMMKTGAGFGLTGCYGPIASANDDSPLYCWRLVYDSGEAAWGYNIYAGGPDGALGVGHLDETGSGRNFTALSIGG